MGPRFFKRGNNGGSGMITFPHNASMGPRFFKRGNLTGQVLALGIDKMLQWGRAFSSAEIVPRVPTLSVAGFASMGPRFFKRGNFTSIKRITIL